MTNEYSIRLAAVSDRISRRRFLQAESRHVAHAVIRVAPVRTAFVC